MKIDAHTYIEKSDLRKIEQECKIEALSFYLEGLFDDLIFSTDVTTFKEDF